MTDTLHPGQSLAPGESLTSQDGRAELIYQTDGNLVLYLTPDGEVIWDSKTAITPPGAAIMQADGNFVLYKADSAGPYWATGTNRPGSSLKLDLAGSINVQDNTGTTVWASSRLHPGQLQVGGYLLPGAQDLGSPAQTYYLEYLQDGNLVLIRAEDGSLAWETKTAGKPAGFVVMQWDGNFVVYGPGGHEAWWGSGTNVPGSFISMQNDGNLVIYAPDGNPLWVVSGALKTVPDVLGESLTPAETVIRAAGLIVGTISGPTSNSKVQNQSPTAGSQVAAGSPVNLTLAAAEQPPEKVILFGLDYNPDRITRVGHSVGPLTGSATITLVTNKTGWTINLGYTSNTVVLRSVVLAPGANTSVFNGLGATADWGGVASPDGGPAQRLYPVEIRYS